MLGKKIKRKLAVVNFINLLLMIFFFKAFSGILQTHLMGLESMTSPSTLLTPLELELTAYFQYMGLNENAPKKHLQLILQNITNTAATPSFITSLLHEVD